jgi:hypothetical protein
MANQLVQRLRQLPVAAAQVLVPAMSLADLEGPGRIRELYTRAYGAIFAAAVPIFCLAAMLVPAISRLWTGHEEAAFMGMMWICTAGWALSTVGTPAYYGNVGTGTLVSNSIGHAVSTLVAFLGGWVGGAYWGAFGVCAGYSLGVAAGGLHVQVAFMRRLGLDATALVPTESRGLVGTSLVALALGLLVDSELARAGWFGKSSTGGHALEFGSLLALFLAVTGATLWWHPLRQSCWMRFARSIRRQPHPS